MPRGLCELTYSFVYPKRIECRLLPFLLCETCVICLYYILCLLWIGYTPLITFSITFHTQTHSEFPPVSFRRTEHNKDCLAWWLNTWMHTCQIKCDDSFLLCDMARKHWTANALIVSVRPYVGKQRHNRTQNVTNSSYQRYFNIPLVSGIYTWKIYILQLIVAHFVDVLW